nr:MAG TPA: hypothetical protein [Caudoviricetes sp.]
MALELQTSLLPTYNVGFSLSGDIQFLLIILFILFIATYLHLRYINQKHIRSYSLTDFIPQGL